MTVGETVNTNAVTKKPYRMPSCSCKDQEPILDVIDSMRGSSRESAEEFLDIVGPKNLCLILHSMRRWYSFQMWNSAKKIIPHRDVLDEYAMDLQPPLGVFRGFKVDRDNPIAEFEPGDVFTLPVKRNGGCTSWTHTEKYAHRFSGASKNKIGIVVKLVDLSGVKPFIAPPAYSEDWFNRLYEKTMGRSFRFKEQEYAIYGKRLIVEVVKIKR